MYEENTSYFKTRRKREELTLYFDVSNVRARELMCIQNGLYLLLKKTLHIGDMAILSELPCREAWNYLKEHGFLPKHGMLNKRRKILSGLLARLHKDEKIMHNALDACSERYGTRKD